MKINYIEKDGKKLFSFHRHDFQSFPTGEFIDGGFDYIRTNTEIKSGEIRDLIKDIREDCKMYLGKPLKSNSVKDLQDAVQVIINQQMNPVLLEIYCLELLHRYERKARKAKTV